MDQNSTIRLAGLSGSLRVASLNTALLRAVPSFVPSGVSVEIVGIGDLPLFNADLADGPAYEPVRRFRESIAQADGLVIVSPEYNYSIPGVLKNALDWGSRGGKDAPLQNKPAAIMGVTPGQFGTVRMQMHLRQMMVYNNMRPVNKPEVMINNALSKFDAAGTLIDPTTENLIRQQLTELVRMIESERSLTVLPVS